jgi:hypothetical protein
MDDGESGTTGCRYRAGIVQVRRLKGNVRHHRYAGYGAERIRSELHLAHYSPGFTRGWHTFSGARVVLSLLRAGFQPARVTGPLHVYLLVKHHCKSEIQEDERNLLKKLMWR